MTQVHETIPEALKPEVEAALAWFNRSQDTPFEVAGILDPEASLEAGAGPRGLRLVLCGGDRCEQRSFRVATGSEGCEVALLDDEVEPRSGPVTPELDPPPGALRGWLDRTLPVLRESARSNDWAVTHPRGYFQPGVLALDGGGRVLSRWRSVPTHRNVGGAIERPTAAHVWSCVQRALATPSDAPDAPLDADPPLDARALPWPLFMSLLVANGWFAEPRGFPHLENGPPPQQRVARAGLRLLGFVGAWVAAFWWLPWFWVASALAAWATWITPKIRVINHEFQDAAPHPRQGDG